MTLRIHADEPSPALLEKSGEFNASTRKKSIARPLVVACSLLIGALCAPPTFAGPHAQVKEVMVKDLPDYPGKEGLLLEVVYPPGSTDEVHRHDAHAFVYVLEGSIVMQLKGGESVTLHPGQTFYEGPNDVHIVGRNASTTKPAKFVVLLLKNKGAPVLTPVH
jgi:quercetin dioxygenase-like cupin family protein